MALKHILAIASGGPGDACALAAAASLGSQHDGVVEVLPVYPDTAADLIALGMTLGSTLSQEAVERLAAAESELHRKIETSARSAAHQADLVFGQGEGAPRLSVLTRGLRPGLALARHAALTDLVVFSQKGIGDGGGEGELFSDCLLGQRTPVLVVRGEPDALSGVAVIAWNGGAQAGRAVRAALPLLAMAAEIHIVQCISGLDREGADPDADLLNGYLRLHGVGEGVVTMVEGADVGAALLAAAEGKRAGLLVAGAWGHSRLRETIFGGATHTFLRRTSGPSLLLAH